MKSGFRNEIEAEIDFLERTVGFRLQFTESEIILISECLSDKLSNNEIDHEFIFTKLQKPLLIFLGEVYIKEHSGSWINPNKEIFDPTHIQCKSGYRDEWIFVTYFDMIDSSFFLQDSKDLLDHPVNITIFVDGLSTSGFSSRYDA